MKRNKIQYKELKIINNYVPTFNKVTINCVLLIILSKYKAKDFLFIIENQ